MREVKPMMDTVFGELRTEDECDWLGKQILEFGGDIHNVELFIHGEDGCEITERQRTAFKCFMERWPKLQTELIEALIKYYNEEERFAWGPDDEKEFAEWWPEIETKDALLQTVTLETIVVANDFLMDDDRLIIYLLFSRTWGGEDYDDNGVGVRYVNEEIDEIAHKDIAF